MSTLCPPWAAHRQREEALQIADGPIRQDRLGSLEMIDAKLQETMQNWQRGVIDPMREEVVRPKIVQKSLLISTQPNSRAEIRFWSIFLARRLRLALALGFGR